MFCLIQIFNLFASKIRIPFCFKVFFESNFFRSNCSQAARQSYGWELQQNKISSENWNQQKKKLIFNKSKNFLSKYEKLFLKQIVFG